MKSEDINVIAKELLFEIYKIIKEEMIPEYRISIDTENLILSSQDFVLTFQPDTAIFIISFYVENTAQQVARVMKCINVVLEYHEIEIAMDSYYDSENHELLYGEAAIEKRYSDYFKGMGMIKCPVCDQYHAIKSLNEKGFCKRCDQLKDYISWH